MSNSGVTLGAGKPSFLLRALVSSDVCIVRGTTWHIREQPPICTERAPRLTRPPHAASAKHNGSSICGPAREVKHSGTRWDMLGAVAHHRGSPAGTGHHSEEGGGVQTRAGTLQSLTASPLPRSWGLDQLTPFSPPAFF